MPTSDDQARGDEPLLPSADAEPDADTEGAALEVVANEGHLAFVDVVSIFALQVAFACWATEQYLEQAGKLMAMTQASARYWWSPMVWDVGDARDLAAAA